MSSDRAAALQLVLDQLDQLSGAYCTPSHLKGLIKAALLVPAPEGSPGTIDNQAATYKTAEDTTRSAGMDLMHVVSSALPTAWRGAAAETAGQALGSVAFQGMSIISGFAGGHKALTTWAGKLREAQKRDGDGRKQLNEANDLVKSLPPANPRFGPLRPQGLMQALGQAKSGCRDMLTAANLAHDAADDAIKALKQSALAARARQITAPGVDPLSAVSLAYTGDGAATGTDPGILSPTAMARASQQLATMSPADRAAFEKLVADAQSPQEAAYLWKALGAGYNISQLAAFDQVIHPFGNDLPWLTKHLNPEVHNNNTTPGSMNQKVLSYDGVELAPEEPGANVRFYLYGQGNYNDCVAASTVVAKLSADPVQMLGVTTGQGPAAVAGDAVGNDSLGAVHNRLQNLYLHNYDVGQTADGVAHPNTTNGIAAKGQAALDGSLLSPATGSTYQIQSLDDPAARQAALPGIQAAASAGKPVPVDVYGQEQVVDRSIPHHRPEMYSQRVNHQMVIVGAHDDKLEIYNPWGYTQWVTTQQFVDGQLGALTSADGSPDGGLPNPYEVQVPK